MVIKSAGNEYRVDEKNNVIGKFEVNNSVSIHRQSATFGQGPIQIYIKYGKGGKYIQLLCT